MGKCAECGDYADCDCAKHLRARVRELDGANAELTRLRKENGRLIAALETIEDDGCDTRSFADCCDKRCRTIARAALAAGGEE